MWSAKLLVKSFLLRVERKTSISVGKTCLFFVTDEFHYSLTALATRRTENDCHYSLVKEGSNVDSSNFNGKRFQSHILMCLSRSMTKRCTAKKIQEVSVSNAFQ